MSHAHNTPSSDAAGVGVLVFPAYCFAAVDSMDSPSIDASPRSLLRASLGLPAPTVATNRLSPSSCVVGEMSLAGPAHALLDCSCSDPALCMAEQQQRGAASTPTMGGLMPSALCLVSSLPLPDAIAPVTLLPLSIAAGPRTHSSNTSSNGTNSATTLTTTAGGGRTSSFERPIRTDSKSVSNPASEDGGILPTGGSGVPPPSTTDLVGSDNNNHATFGRRDDNNTRRRSPAAALPPAPASPFIAAIGAALQALPTDFVDRNDVEGGEGTLEPDEEALFTVGPLPTCPLLHPSHRSRGGGMQQGSRDCSTAQPCTLAVTAARGRVGHSLTPAATSTHSCEQTPSQHAQCCASVTSLQNNGSTHCLLYSGKAMETPPAGEVEANAREKALWASCSFTRVTPKQALEGNLGGNQCGGVVGGGLMPAWLPPPTASVAVPHGAFPVSPPSLLFPERLVADVLRANGGEVPKSTADGGGAMREELRQPSSTNCFLKADAVLPAFIPPPAIPYQAPLALGGPAVPASLSAPLPFLFGGGPPVVVLPAATLQQPVPEDAEELN